MAFVNLTAKRHGICHIYALSCCLQCGLTRNKTNLLPPICAYSFFTQIVFFEPKQEDLKDQKIDLDVFLKRQ